MNKKIKELSIYGGTSLGWLEDAEEVEKEELLLKDLCARLPYGVKCHVPTNGKIMTLTGKRLNYLCFHDEDYGLDYRHEYETVIDPLNDSDCNYVVKPYLRPMSSMIEEEAKEISILYGFKDILSAKITDGYIDVVVDDGFCNTETRTIWYDEIISSIEIFDWLNAHYFDYRGLIEKGLALEAPADMYNIKEK